MSQISLIIDSEDKNAVSASLAFFQALSGEALEIKSEVSETSKVSIKEADKTVKSKPQKAKTEPVKELTQEEQEAPAISLNDLRLLVASKAKAHKPEIKAWLEGKGFTKTPELPTELYGEYVEFLNSLS